MKRFRTFLVLACVGSAFLANGASAQDWIRQKAHPPLKFFVNAQHSNDPHLLGRFELEVVTRVAKNGREEVVQAKLKQTTKYDSRETRIPEDRCHTSYSMLELCDVGAAILAKLAEPSIVEPENEGERDSQVTHPTVARYILQGREYDVDFDVYQALVAAARRPDTRIMKGIGIPPEITLITDLDPTSVVLGSSSAGTTIKALKNVPVMIGEFGESLMKYSFSLADFAFTNVTRVKEKLVAEKVQAVVRGYPYPIVQDQPPQDD